MEVGINIECAAEEIAGGGRVALRRGYRPRAEEVERFARAEAERFVGCRVRFFALSDRRLDEGAFL